MGLKNTSRIFSRRPSRRNWVSRPKSEFEHRAAAHGHRFVRVAGKAERDGAGLQGGHLLAQALDGCDALAGQDGMLDAGQLLDEAAAAGDHQAVVGDGAGAGLQLPAVRAEPGCLAGDEIDALLAEEFLQRHHQVLGLALAGRQPDQAGQVGQRRLRREQRDLRRAIVLAQATCGGQGGKAAADDGDVLGHGFSGTWRCEFGVMPAVGTLWLRGMRCSEPDTGRWAPLSPIARPRASAGQDYRAVPALSRPSVPCRRRRAR
jgi:hypothetical protein